MSRDQSISTCTTSPTRRPAGTPASPGTSTARRTSQPGSPSCHVSFVPGMYRSLQHRSARKCWHKLCSDDHKRSVRPALHNSLEGERQCDVADEKQELFKISFTSVGDKSPSEERGYNNPVCVLPLQRRRSRSVSTCTTNRSSRL